MKLKTFTLGMLMLLVMLCVPAHAQAHSVSLSWAASTDSGVSYNVYRMLGACPASGTSGFSKINAASVAATTYTDSALSPGAYCYYVTSVLNGAESVPSNFAPAVILPAAPTALSVTSTN